MRMPQSVGLPNLEQSCRKTPRAACQKSVHMSSAKENARADSDIGIQVATYHDSLPPTAPWKSRG